jgi:hypothetical protein
MSYNFAGVLCMNHTEVINTIIHDDRYKSVCKRTAKKPHLSDDLYQEFILSVLEIKDDRLIRAKQGNYLEVFCISIINNIWSNRHRVRMTIGKTNPLYEYSNSVDVSENLFTKDESLNYDIDFLCTKVHKQIAKDITSSDIDTVFRSRVFYYSYSQMLPELAGVKVKIPIKNPRQYSEKVKIPYINIIKICNAYKHKLKKLIEGKYSENID